MVVPDASFCCCNKLNNALVLLLLLLLLPMVIPQSLLGGDGDLSTDDDMFILRLLWGSLVRSSLSLSLSLVLSCSISLWSNVLYWFCERDGKLSHPKSRWYVMDSFSCYRKYCTVLCRKPSVRRTISTYLQFYLLCKGEYSTVKCWMRFNSPGRWHHAIVMMM